MGGRIERSLTLMGASWRVLGQGKDLILIPVASMAALVVWTLLCRGAALAFGAEDRLLDFAIDRSFSSFGRLAPVDYVLIYACVAGGAFLTVFFNAAIVAAALERLEGRQASARDGIRMTWERRTYVLEWALFSATVGLIVMAIRSKGDWVGRVFAWLFDIAWGYATVFVAPVLVTREVGPIDALRSSAALFKKTWGENIVQDIGMGVLVLGAIIAAVAIALPVGVAFGLIPGIVVAGVLIAAVSAVFSAFDSVFNAALFRYATTGEPPAAFASLDLGRAYIPKAEKKS